MPGNPERAHCDHDEYEHGYIQVEGLTFAEGKRPGAVPQSLDSLTVVSVRICAGCREL